jgi:hypothetical protein
LEAQSIYIILHFADKPVLRSGAQYIMRDEAPIVNVKNKMSSIIKSLLRIFLDANSELRARAIEHVEKNLTSA